MFGPMMIEPVAQVEPNADLQIAVETLMKITEDPEIVRWIEFPNSVLLFQLARADPNSGSIYLLDRKKGTWYALDFEDEQFGGYSLAQFEALLTDCSFLDLIERPDLLSNGLSWVVLPGIKPEAAV